MTHQVTGEDDLGALLEEELDGGDGGADAGVIGDLLGVVERDVEVGAHEHLLPLQIRLAEGSHAPLGRHHSPARSSTRPDAAGGEGGQSDSDSDDKSTRRPDGDGSGDSPRVGRTGSNRRTTRSVVVVGCDEVSFGRGDRMCGLFSL